MNKKSGLIPDGDVRLTANINLNIHHRLKVASVTHRTTMGEIIERLIAKHLNDVLKTI